MVQLKQKRWPIGCLFRFAQSEAAFCERVAKRRGRDLSSRKRTLARRRVRTIEPAPAGLRLDSAVTKKAFL